MANNPNKKNLRKMLPDDTSNKLFEKKIWTISDVACATGYSIATLYNMTSRREIPFQKRRGRVFFDPLEIQNWVFEGD